MADNSRYATDAFTNFSQFESGVFVKGQEQSVGSTDNPDFLYPPDTLRNAATGTSQKIQRGYMRMLTQGFSGGSTLSKRRLHFQFNPDTIVRSVQARNDIQNWMNQDPILMMSPIPGDANFAFDLLFNREAEIASGSYKEGSSIKQSQEKAFLPLGDMTKDNKDSVTIPHSAVTDIGVLADLIVFDEIIGQGVNTQLIDKMVKNAAGISAKKRQDATKNADPTNTPPSVAQIKIKTDGDGKLKDGTSDVIYTTRGSGYVSTPSVTVDSDTGSGAVISVFIDSGQIKEVKVDNKGSGYPANSEVSLKFDGGGGGSTSSDSTKDAQDQPADFNEDDATQNLYTNFGNSAFLVSLPVRIVFSSLFMVEGYITSTMVTFNKFNANMVPTQCVVSVTMQAMYIGFARKETYMTKNLADGLKVAETAYATKDAQQQAENAALVALGKNLFSKIQQSYVGKDTNRQFGVNQMYYDGTDLKHTLEIAFYPSTELLAQLKKSSIAEVVQNGTWTIIYEGNDNPATPKGNGTLDPGDSVCPAMTATAVFNKGDLKDNWDTSVLSFTAEPLPVSDNLDTTSTSRYRVQYDIHFVIKTPAGEEANAEQYFSAVGVGAYGEAMSIFTHGSLVHTYDPNALPRTGNSAR